LSNKASGRKKGETMKLRILLLLGGAGLLVYGGVFCLNNLNALKVIGEGGEVSLSWTAAVLVALPFLTALAGLFGLMAGIFGRNWMLTWSNFLGLKFVFLSALLMTAAVFFDRSVLAPCYEHLGAWLFGGPFAIDSKAYLYSLLLFALIIQIYQAGIDFAEYGTIDFYIVIHALTRALFVLIAIPLCLGSSKLVMTDKTMSPMAFAGLGAWFVLVFMNIRLKAEQGEAIKRLFLTILCVPALAVYYIAMQFIYKYLGFILDWKIIVPLFLMGFILVQLVGFKLDHVTKKFGHSICSWCGLEFEGLFEYCTSACLNEAKSPVVLQCKTCGKPFTITKENHRSGWYTPYCSSACTPVTIYTCGKCGREISGRNTTCSCGAYNS
jgi:hypothetical protein